MTSRNGLAGPFVGLLIAFSACSPCNTQVLATVPSPDGELHAVHWLAYCGALSSGNVGVTIASRDSEFDADAVPDPNTVFEYLATLTGEGGYTRVVGDTITWTANRHLRIAYDARRPVLRKTTVLDDVQIRFRSHRPTAATPPQN